jgi:hypothetical protein
MLERLFADADAGHRRVTANTDLSVGGRFERLLDSETCRCTSDGSTVGTGSASARRGPINGGPHRQFIVGPGLAMKGRSLTP